MVGSVLQAGYARAVRAEIPNVLADLIEVASEELGRERATELLVEAAAQAGLDLATVGGEPVSKSQAESQDVDRDTAIRATWQKFWLLYLAEAPGLFPGHEAFGDPPGADGLAWLHARRAGALDRLELTDAELQAVEHGSEIVSRWLAVQLARMNVEVPRESCRELREIHALLGYGLACASSVPDLRGEGYVCREALELYRQSPNEYHSLPLSIIHEETHAALAGAGCPGARTSPALLARWIDEDLVTTTECALSYALDRGVDDPTVGELMPHVPGNPTWPRPFDAVCGRPEFTQDTPITAVVSEWKSLLFQAQRMDEEEEIAMLLNDRFGEDWDWLQWCQLLYPYNG
jgi:hypothetical protein